MIAIGQRVVRAMLSVTRTWLLMLFVSTGTALSSCSDSPTAPTEAFSLPPDAPADATVAPGTTRIVVTAIQILTPDGRLANPGALQGNTVDRFRAWIFCPRGLEGAFDFAVPFAALSGTGGSLRPGYNNVSDSVFIQSSAGSYPFRFDVIREFVVIASKEITLVVRP